MHADVKASKGKDTRDFVRKVTFTAGSPLDELKLSLITYALMPLTTKTHDAEFNKWLSDRIAAYCVANKVRIVTTVES
jgi:hypothetical protein